MEGAMAEVLLNRNVALIDEVAEWIELRGGPSLASILDGLQVQAEAEGLAQAPTAAILHEILQYRVQYEEPAAAALRRRKENEVAAVAKKLSFGDGGYRDENLNLVSALDPDFAGLCSCPRVSSLALRVSPEPDLCAAVAARHNFMCSGAFIAGAHHNIIALYVGAYHPCFHEPGFYLVFDAYADSLAAVPQLPASFVSMFSHSGGIGTGPAVLRLGPPSSGSYLLAELVPRIGSGGLATSSASLCVWRYYGPHGSSSCSWEHKQVNLPQLPSSQHDFFADTPFAAGYDDDVLCWVDLLMGVLVCKDVVLSPVFTFIPLPDGYHVRPDDPVHGRRRGITPPEHYRCMAPSVNGTVKFVSLDGYLEGWGPSDVILTSWSLELSGSESGWAKLQSFRIGDVVWSWPSTTPLTDDGSGSASPASFRASCPLLSAVNDDVVYLDMMQAGPLPGYHVALRNGRVDKFTRAQSKPVARKLVSSFTMFLNLNKDH